MNFLPSVPLVARGVRLFVQATGGVAPVFDPSLLGRFAVGAPPAGWMDAGNVVDLERGAATEFAEVYSGAPAVVKTRGRAKVSASVACTLTGWSKLQLLLSGGGVGMNLLRHAASGGSNDDSGGQAEAALPVMAGSTATVLLLAAGVNVQPGDAVVVDADYTGQTGWLGAGVAGMNLADATAVGADVDYVRRVSLNVARVAAVTEGAAVTTVTLAAALPAGVPAAGTSAQVVLGFTDRVGGTYVPEWSAVFVVDGVQGDRLLLHYPRLQPANGATETADALAAGLERWRQRVNLTALPVTDPNDGAAVLCFRTYLPAPGRAL